MAHTLKERSGCNHDIVSCEHCKPSPNTWEEEFDRKFGTRDYQIKSSKVPEKSAIYYDALKQFIASQISLAARCKKDEDPSCPCWLDGFTTCEAEGRGRILYTM